MPPNRNVRRLSSGGFEYHIEPDDQRLAHHRPIFVSLKVLSYSLVRSLWMHSRDPGTGVGAIASHG